MERELLEILACPRCKGELHLEADESGLRCTACRLVYRIEDGIPILMVEEAVTYE
jgi:hypothetical protein